MDPCGGNIINIINSIIFVYHRRAGVASIPVEARKRCMWQVRYLTCGLVSLSFK